MEADAADAAAVEEEVEAAVVGSSEAPSCPFSSSASTETEAAEVTGVEEVGTVEAQVTEGEAEVEAEVEAGTVVAVEAEAATETEAAKADAAEGEAVGRGEAREAQAAVEAAGGEAAPRCPFSAGSSDGEAAGRGEAAEAGRGEVEAEEASRCPFNHAGSGRGGGSQREEDPIDRTADEKLRALWAMLSAETLPSSDAASPAWPQKAAIYNSFFGKGSSGSYEVRVPYPNPNPNP